MESEGQPLLETALDSTWSQQDVERPQHTLKFKGFPLQNPWIKAYIFVIHLLLGLLAFVLAFESCPNLDPAPFCKSV